MFSLGSSIPLDILSEAVVIQEGLAVRVVTFWACACLTFKFENDAGLFKRPCHFPVTLMHCHRYRDCGHGTTLRHAPSGSD